MNDEELRTRVAREITDEWLRDESIWDNAMKAADAVLSLSEIDKALAVFDAMKDQAPVLIVPRRLLVEVDSIASLVAYRYPRGLPDDVRAELLELSAEARRLYEPSAAAGLSVEGKPQ